MKDNLVSTTHNQTYQKLILANGIICNRAIINTARIEVDYYWATGEVASTNFIPTEIQKPKSVGGYVHRIDDRHPLQNTLEKLSNE